MTTNSKPRSVAQIASAVKKGTVTFDSYLQRKAGQWSKLQKSKLIDSILRGYPIPPVYAIVITSQKESVIDGCQRLTSICEFMDGGFSLSRELPPVEINDSEEEIKGKKFDDLPDSLKDVIKNTDITIVTLSNYKPDELVDIFDRLNGGTPLSPAQKFKVYMNFDFAGNISRIASNEIYSAALSETQIKRDANQEVVVQSLMLLTDKKYPFNGFGKPNIKKFLNAYVPNCDLNDLEQVADISDVLTTIVPKDCKTMTKGMLPPIIKAMQPIYQDKTKVNKFKAKLEAFLADPTANTEYMKYATLHTTTKENVEGRVAFFEKMAK